MSKSAIFEVQEFHRGDWQPILNRETKKPRTVVIPLDRAERMNGDQVATKIRYVEVKSEEPETEDSDLKAEYEEKFGKKPHHKWDDEKIKEKLAEKE